MGQDLDLLQGSWNIAGLEMDGQKMSGDMLTGAQIVVKGNRFTSTGMGAVYKGTMTLDTSANPHHIDMKFTEGPEKGNTNLGIYRLKGDAWKICLATRGTVRPSRFASTPGSGFAVETLTRGDVKVKGSKKAAVKAANNGPATEFEGEWKLVSAVMDGKPMEESLVQWVKRVTQGNQTTVYAGPQVMLKVEFTSDASKSPKAIDYLNLAGANKGKSQKGIYEFEGKILKFCVAKPGAARPREFHSVRGDGGTLTVWKRG